VYNVLDVLERTGVRATFFVPGWIAENYRSAVEAVSAAGHELALHGWCHEPPGDISTAELADTLTRAGDLLADIGGKRPAGYRSPSFQMTPEALEVLRGLGLHYDSSLMGDDRPYRIGGLVEVPVDWATDDAVFYRYTGGESRPPVAEVAAALRRGTLCNLTMHPWQSGRPARVERLAELLAWAREQPGLWIGPVGELAAHHATLEDRMDS
jgi:peptidoglycan/xylan/chitin deacetylase (PgdA/CDA1 family)